MDLARLRARDAWSWELPRRGDERRHDVVLYGSRELLASMDDKVLEQIGNVARLPGLVGAAMTMPDAHWGYGFPIGGVAAFDPEAGGIVSAGGVGFDISCGIRCMRTGLTLDAIAPKLRQLADALYRDIPAGVGEEGPLRLTVPELDDVLAGGARWAVANGYGDAADLELHRGARPGRATRSRRTSRRWPNSASWARWARWAPATTTSRCRGRAHRGRRRRTRVRAVEGQVLVSIHCGSRGLGHQIGTEFLLSLAKGAARLGIALPDRELACAPIRSPEGRAVPRRDERGDQLRAREPADPRAPRRAPRLRATSADAAMETLFDVSHNTCKAEQHVVDGKTRRLYVHRKGATRAFGPGHPALPARYRDVGQPVIVGGSMGTASWILAGTS